MEDNLNILNFKTSENEKGHNRIQKTRMYRYRLKNTDTDPAPLVLHSFIKLPLQTQTCTPGIYNHLHLTKRLQFLTNHSLHGLQLLSNLTRKVILQTNAIYVLRNSGLEKAQVQNFTSPCLKFKTKSIGKSSSSPHLPGRELGGQNISNSRNCKAMHKTCLQHLISPS